MRRRAGPVLVPGLLLACWSLGVGFSAEAPKPDAAAVAQTPAVQLGVGAGLGGRRPRSSCGR